MIKKLRVRFIRIATVSAAAVLLLLCLIVNIAHFATVNGDLTDMLVMIAQNRGRVPGSPADEPGKTDNTPRMYREMRVIAPRTVRKHRAIQPLPTAHRRRAHPTPAGHRAVRRAAINPARRGMIKNIA